MSCLCTVISTSDAGVVERCGKFSHIAHPGMNFVCWPFCHVSNLLSLRLQQLSIRCETKTKDNVFVLFDVSVQYQVIQEKVYDACYKLSDTKQQIEAYVFDVIRSTVPRMELDEAFVSKEEISTAVKNQLSAAMHDYGYVIVKALVTDIAPDNRVKSAMNEINASKRLREAAAEKAEGEKVLLVKAAEAHAESQYLSGVGVAKQRKAIVNGLKESVNYFAGSVQGAGPKEVINLLMVTQYFDMLEQIGTHSRQSTIFIPHSPDSVMSLQNQLNASMRVTNK